MPHFKAARLALWDGPHSVECASLYSKEIHFLLITYLSLNSFWDETSRTWTLIGPETRYQGFWLGLSPSTWVQDSIWDKWFQLPSMDYPLLQLFLVIKDIFHLCFQWICLLQAGRTWPAPSWWSQALTLYFLLWSHAKREERSQGMKRLGSFIPMSHLSNTVSIWGPGQTKSSCNLEATSSIFWGPKSLAAARIQTFK